MGSGFLRRTVFLDNIERKVVMFTIEIPNLKQQILKTIGPTDPVQFNYASTALLTVIVPYRDYATAAGGQAGQHVLQSSKQVLVAKQMRQRVIA